VLLFLEKTEDSEIIKGNIPKKVKGYSVGELEYQNAPNNILIDMKHQSNNLNIIKTPLIVISFVLVHYEYNLIFAFLRK